MTRNTILKHAIFAATLFSGCLNAYALESDRNQPISIEADQASLDQKNQVTVFSGNVIVKQGTLNMRAAAVRVTQDKSGNQTMSAQGSPAYFRQQLDNNKGLAEGWGNRMEYVSKDNMVKLIGNAKVQRGGDMAQGEAISYNTRTEVYTVLGGAATGNKNGRRVHVIIQPNNKK
ncbi:lipopolysaccharide transport periplasmic protein LptA [Wielerella bovis]|uniref:lipopolysaccharide transport periplasmic protein LptA n=1 Tax=Wielerella bovis TaxID=2917790 RepID=UPI002018FDFB|nr:lipopolysaccharide transport periplasmic protein LptA [Wielerella bovis]MCG7657583.1 lipopolysaccharide transport periplasmic protein LptA [Wielerella bovis]MCG7659804.1 lipopolysaccharide transport periplasmic protein LptA [Wielerella bovis]ULJ59796.1 lipopolysaccharide transport periplasmic protein LptA [Wielerella bovis]ULJ62000.1 lipopolysaccharide transport periplasmic protein LptA [Wielerella bovis]ULJ64225.1 lipopolysaccharide transport periplasmic protein LptA [Wielerella bovis]